MASESSTQALASSATPEILTPPLSASSLPVLTSPSPQVPDHELLRCIGRGSYGEVWLARNVVGALRAIKIVRRSNFSEPYPFEREFKGIQKYEPVSRSHDSLIDILHLGWNDQAGYFYYVMELADPVEGIKSDELRTSKETRTSKIENTDCGKPNRSSNLGSASTLGLCPDSYSPRTLRSELKRRGRLPPEECLLLALSLSSALEHLHRQGLVHRDVKPSNIIFVNGVPKLADIGLVADVDEARSFVGTVGFIPPEGPGTPEADVYGLGKVLYEILTGKDRQEFPALPNEFLSTSDPLGERNHECKSAPGVESERQLATELNCIVLRACESNPKARYRSAQMMYTELAALQSGRSVRRAHRIQRRWYYVLRGVAGLTAAAIVIGLMFLFGRFLQPSENPETSKRSTNSVAQTEYDEGRSFYRKTGDMKAAAAHFQNAVNADPNFLLAQAALATTLCWGTGRDAFRYDSFSRLGEAATIAQDALARDDNLSDAHLAMAWHAFVREWDWPKAIRHFEKAIRCDPNSSQPHEWYGMFLRSIGRTNQAIDQLRIAERLNGSEPSVNDFFGQVLFAARRYSEATEKFEKALAMPEGTKENDEWFLARSLLWRDKNRTNEAIDRWLLASYGAGESWVLELRQILRDKDQATFWNQHLEALRKRSTDSLILAGACAFAGRNEEALDFLVKARNEHHDFLVLTLKTDPEWDNLRSDSRFRALLRSLKLE